MRDSVGQTTRRIVMPQHIGIVGCTAEGAALCYRTICQEGMALSGSSAHPEVTMHTPSFAGYQRCLDADDIKGIGEIMLASAHTLAAAGADFLICPANTMHLAFSYVQPRSPLPWLHIADEVAAAAAGLQFHRLGLLGTPLLMGSSIYPQALSAKGIECLLPPAEARPESGRIITEELIRGDFRADSIAWYQNLIENFRAQGCDAVILGCTEIPLVINDANSALPTLDSTRLLARAAIQRAIR